MRITAEVPVRWRSRVLLFTPAHSFGERLGLEISSVIIDGTQSSFYVRVGNFSAKPVSIDAGLLIGQLTPLPRSHLVRELIVPAENPEAVQGTHDRPSNPDVVPLHAGQTRARSPEAGVRDTVCVWSTQSLREGVRVELELKV